MSSLLQIKKELKELKEAMNPENTGGNIFIYEPAKGIPGELLEGEGFRIFIPDNGRDPELTQLC